MGDTNTDPNPNPNDDPKDPDAGKDGKQFTPIQSQEDFDAAIKDRLARERAKVPTDYKDVKAKADQFDKLEADKLPEIERITKTANDEKSRADTAEAKLMRYEVAADKGLPLSSAKRLHGDTREEMEADADELKKLLGDSTDGKGKRGPNPDPSQGAKKATELSDKERGLAKARERGFIKT